jgi:hypothetical protein
LPPNGGKLTEAPFGCRQLAAEFQYLKTGYLYLFSMKKQSILLLSKKSFGKLKKQCQKLPIISPFFILSPL